MIYKDVRFLSKDKAEKLREKGEYTFMVCSTDCPICQAIAEEREMARQAKMRSEYDHLPQEHLTQRIIDDAWLNLVKYSPYMSTMVEYSTRREFQVIDQETLLKGVV